MIDEGPHWSQAFGDMSIADPWAVVCDILDHDPLHASPSYVASEIARRCGLSWNASRRIIGSYIAHGWLEVVPGVWRGFRQILRRIPPKTT